MKKKLTQRDVRRTSHNSDGIPTTPTDFPQQRRRLSSIEHHTRDQQVVNDNAIFLTKLKNIFSLVSLFNKHENVITAKQH